MDNNRVINWEEASLTTGLFGSPPSPCCLLAELLLSFSQGNKQIKIRNKKNTLREGLAEMLAIEGEAERLCILRSLNISKLSKILKIIKEKKKMQAVTQIILSWNLFIPRKEKNLPRWL